MTLSYKCGVCGDVFDCFDTSAGLPEGWHEVEDRREGSYYDRAESHACSIPCLTEVAMRLSLDEESTPTVAPEPAMVKPKRTRARKSTEKENDERRDRRRRRDRAPDD